MEDAFTFAHLSDLHLSTPSPVGLGDLLNKRALGYLSWKRRRRKEHRREVLDAAVRDIADLAVAQIVITGDLTNLGLPREFREVRDWLRDLGPAEHVMVVPGNHDTYARTAFEATLALWSPWYGDGLVEDATMLAPRGHFPFIRVRDQVALIGLCSARPTAPLLATGTLGHDQLEALEDLLATSRARGLFRVIVMHHPPDVGAVGWRKRLTDDAGLQAVLGRVGAELILHGHAHRPSQAQLETATGPVPVVGAPSSSAFDERPERRARYFLHRVARREDIWELEIVTRAWNPEASSFEAEGRRRLAIQAARGAH